MGIKNFPSFISISSLLGSLNRESTNSVNRGNRYLGGTSGPMTVEATQLPSLRGLSILYQYGSRPLWPSSMISDLPLDSPPIAIRSIQRACTSQYGKHRFANRTAANLVLRTIRNPVSRSSVSGSAFIWWIKRGRISF
ncbi:hypothetical protein I7I50_01715 [Histoplasma capsulatum G186AR]|uniref:Uncharacterized protein n=1 Tax=Ajellomyces capsulatus TaxID=5037 RepID=A0A8H7YEN5_AJECA|nr:hypothetical protein I7I52_11929 [Histoplasma capsulatum]QSS71011.1 hypothetical protein I7I50_01715 [Histoplasma capsulatum G186AR]